MSVSTPIILYNQTQHQPICPVVEAPSLITKAVGLIGSSTDKALYFKTRWGIHTLGMYRSLTILVCDDKFQVKTIKTPLKCGRFFFWNPLWQHVFELPYQEYPVTIGDILCLTKSLVPTVGKPSPSPKP